MGINFNNREKTKDVNEWFLGLGQEIVNDQPRQITTAPSPATGQVTRLNHIGFPGGIATYDPRSILGSYQRVRNAFGDVAINKNWAVEEDVIQPYFKFAIDSNIGDVGVSGNVGMQLVFTDQSSTAPAGGSFSGWR